MHEYRNCGIRMIVKMIVAYDGTHYNGWQIQPQLKSVQETIEKALGILHKQDVIKIVGSGRTDAQVHAMGQVFHFETTLNIPADRWPRALNAYLPKDIRIQSASIEPDDFHARFSAVSKRYDYLVTTDKTNPFIQNYMGKIYGELNLQRMKECAQVFIGTHDFTSFCSAEIEPLKPKVKTITRIEITEESGAIRISYEGNGFLRYMVRMLSGTIIQAGLGKIDAKDAKRMLEGQDKHQCPYKAEACGLYLMRVDY